MNNKPLETGSNEMHVRQTTNRIRLTGIYLFIAILFFIALTGLIVPLRPKTSDIEKRTLTAFPKFTLKDFLDGDYFSNIDMWYSDTFPFREQLISVNSSLNALYGLAGEEIHGSIGMGDDIPSAPHHESPSISAAPSASSEEDTSGNISADTEQSSSEEETTLPPETAPSVDSPYDHAEPEVNGAVYVAGNSAYNLFYFNLDKSNRYIDVLNRTADYLDGLANVYSILVPTSTGIMLSEQQQNDLGCSSSGKAIDYMYSSMNAGIKTVPVFDELMRHRDEYIYFRTDHHWTALGAYYAYRMYAAAAGFTPHELSDFETRAFPGFLGSYYASSDQSPALSATPDTVMAYMPIGTNSMTFYDADLNPTKWFIVNDVSGYKASNKYSCFIGGDNAYSVIENPSITDGSACLVYKDSYGNPFVTFLVDHYQTVYVIDSRYYTVNMKQFVVEHHVTDVIFLNNLESITDATANNLASQLQ